MPSLLASDTEIFCPRQVIYKQTRRNFSLQNNRTIQRGCTTAGTFLEEWMPGANIKRLLRVTTYTQHIVLQMMK